MFNGRIKIIKKKKYDVDVCINKGSHYKNGKDYKKNKKKLNPKKYGLEKIVLLKGKDDEYVVFTGFIKGKDLEKIYKNRTKETDYEILVWIGGNSFNL